MGSVLWLKIKKMRGEIAMYIIMLAMALVLTYVFSGAIFGEYYMQRVYAVDNDMSEESQQFLDNLDPQTYMVELAESDEAQVGVAKGEVTAAVEIPKGFGEDLKAGSATLTVVKSSENTDVMALENTVRAAANKTAHVYGLYEKLDAQMTVIDAEAPSLGEVTEMYEARMGDNALVQVEKTMNDANDYDEQFAGNVHFLMGFNIFFVMFSIVFTIGSILEDKKFGTWNRMRITPLSGMAILGGNLIPTVFVGVVQMALVLFGGEYLFGIDLGDSVWPVFLVFVVYVLAVTSLGLLLTTVLRTYEQLNAAAPVIVVATSMLGGCMWPLDIVPQALQTVAKFTPQYWALEATETLPVTGGGFADALTSIYVLLGMTALFFGLSLLFFRRKQKA